MPLLSLAQSTSKPFGFQYDQRPTVGQRGRAFLNPWVGGLNAAQFGTMRLNADARDDLVVFDPALQKVFTFVAVDGASGLAWQYAPQYEAAFPTLYNWMRLVDYDGDGRKDVFTSLSGDIRRYRNESTDGQVRFRGGDSLVTQSFNGIQPLYVSPSDIPDLVDFDDDGDMDVVTFSITGDQMAYFQNLSVERTGRKDGLDFKRAGGVAWGNFRKEYCNDFTFNFLDTIGPGSVPNPAGANPAVPRRDGARPLHSGNTVTVVDTDGDGRKDLLFGFVSCSNIARLRNGGTNDSLAHFVSFDSLFPAQKPIVFPAFPATFWEDVDGDGRKDLLASPNVVTNENYAFDFRATNWFYKNVGTNQKPDFQFVQPDFLQQDMLDLGENAAPALTDLDGDGDLDLLIGFGGAGTGTDYRAGLWELTNRGTNARPDFDLVSTDYLGLSRAQGLTNTVPQSADVDANGSPDLIITGLRGQTVEVWLLLNTAPRGQAVQYDPAKATRWPTPDRMGLLDRLYVTDVDRDGRLDALVGKRLGLIEYFRNVGTAQTPVFQLQNQNFGNLSSDPYGRNARSLVVADLNGDQKPELISAAQGGQVAIYRFPEQPDQTLTLLDSLPELGRAGLRLTAATGDLDGDQLPDLLLGTANGGLRYLKNTSQKVVVTGVPEEPTGPWAFPNPTNRYVTVRPPRPGRVDLLTVSGRVVRLAQPVPAHTETQLDLGDLPGGTYLLRLAADGQPTRVEKIIVSK